MALMLASYISMYLHFEIDAGSSDFYNTGERYLAEEI